MLKRKPIHRNKVNEQVNKKALIWIGVGMVAIIIAMAILLFFNS